MDFTTGLSPLARGTLRPDLPAFQITRFIPAGAGNTTPRPDGRDNQSVYPRWRGEHETKFKIAKIANGLSPLARGTHFPRSVCRLTPRFIPAGAGNT